MIRDIYSSGSGKTYGTWRGERAFLWDGCVYRLVGSHGSWVKASSNPSEFQPYTEADLNDPKHRVGLRRIGEGYVPKGAQ